MHKYCTVMVGVALVASTHALTAQAQPEDRSLTGTVDSMYVREHSGLYMDMRLTPCGRQMSSPTIVGNRIVYLGMRSAPREQRCEQLWALVRIPAKGDGVPDSELVKVPADVELHVGDDVEIAMGENKTYKATGPLHKDSRMVRRLKTKEQFAQEPSHGSMTSAEPDL